MILLSLSRCPSLGCCLNLDIVMTCTALSNLSSPEIQISCPTVVGIHSFDLDHKSQIGHSLGGLLLPVVF